MLKKGQICWVHMRCARAENGKIFTSFRQRKRWSSIYLRFRFRSRKIVNCYSMQC